MMTKLKAILTSGLVVSTVAFSGCVVDPAGWDRPHHHDRYDRYDRDGRNYDRDGRYDHRGDGRWGYGGRWSN